MARRPKLKKKSPRREKGGGLGRMVFLILVVGGCYLFWHHVHGKSAGTHIAHEAAPVSDIDAAVAASIAKAQSSPQPQPQTQTETEAQLEAQPQPQQQTQSQQVVISKQSPSDFPRPVQNVLEAQVALARRAISPGSIDGKLGSQTREAISVFQETENLSVTGDLDDETMSNLTLAAPILTSYTVTTNDLGSLQPLGATWLAKSQQSSLAYETELELIAEKNHSSPTLIEKLNPDVIWPNIAAGMELKVPDVKYPDPDGKAAFVVIHLSDRFLEAFDEQTNLILHFPCSIAKKVEKRPVGELHVVVVIQNPNYTVDPELFPESDELQKIGHKLILPPGPKNPVGVAWMGLDKPGYGMHGTPNAQEVGRTESHGCFRLANWDAAYLSQIVWVGMPVEVEQ